jgi:hypothetical protein
MGWLRLSALVPYWPLLLIGAGRRAPAALDAAQGRQWHVRLSPRCWSSASRSSRWAWPGCLGNAGRIDLLATLRAWWPLTLVVWGVLELVAFALGRDARRSSR